MDSENTIYVDTREKDVPVLPNITMVRTTLSYGDFTWPSPIGQILIERKSHNDLINSIKDGRWQRQIPNLLACEGIPILLLERFGSGGLSSGWTFEGLDQALANVQLAGVFTFYYWPGRLGPRLLSLFRSTKAADHSTFFQQRKRIIGYDRNESAALSILASFPGSGPTTARKILNNTGTAGVAIQRILEGGPIPGIGPAKVRMWREVLERTSNH